MSSEQDRTWQALAARLDRLERQNRRLRLAVFGAAVLLGAGLLMGAVAAPKTVEAEEFVVKDAAGRVRAHLWENGLMLIDEKGKARVGMGVTQNGSTLFLRDENERGRVDLSVIGGDPTLFLRDEKGQARVGMGVTQSGSALSLRDEKGQVRVGMAVIGGDPSLSVNDENERVRALLGVSKLVAANGDKTTTAPSSLALFDDEGKVLFRAPTR